MSDKLITLAQTGSWDILCDVRAAWMAHGCAVLHSTQMDAIARASTPMPINAARTSRICFACAGFSGSYTMASREQLAIDYIRGIVGDKKVIARPMADAHAPLT